MQIEILYFAADCLEAEMFSCQEGQHLFCKECINGASEVSIGYGRTHLACLAGDDCKSNINLTTLSKALDPKMFSQWLRKIQEKEVQDAKIDGMEHCPFCPFAMIMISHPTWQPTFTCQQPDCQRKSCPISHKPAHHPLGCKAVAKDADTAKRTYIENKMTEASIRICYSCRKPFVKQAGCNKMTCECGAIMCYLCRKPIKGYSHFGEKKDETPKPPHQVCPLFSDNVFVHQTEVTRAEMNARTKVDADNPIVALITAPILKHFHH